MQIVLNSGNVRNGSKGGNNLKESIVVVEIRPLGGQVKTRLVEASLGTVVL
jgi:hypothetical protein